MQVRRILLKMIYNTGTGHPGGALSTVEILVRLYSTEMRLCPERPDWPERDRFILSKGHACAALYAVLALCGLLAPSELKGFRQLNSSLQGHPHISTPGVDTSTGSLGQGFSSALGMALGLRHQGLAARVYVLLGDGELQEGMIWEGALFAAHHGLSNVCAIVDYNRLQSDAPVQEVMGLEPMRDKWEAFGWHVVDCNGHAFESLNQAFAVARTESRRPTLIIAQTVKGKGVSFMENESSWHGALTLSERDYVAALRELGVSDSDLPNYLDPDWWDLTA